MWPCTGAQYNEWYGPVLGFESISSAWKQLLSRPDEDIGLWHPGNLGARQGGYYRDTLLEMLRAWEGEVNDQYKAILLVVLGPSTGPHHSLYWARVRVLSTRSRPRYSE